MRKKPLRICEQCEYNVELKIESPELAVRHVAIMGELVLAYCEEHKVHAVIFDGSDGSFTCSYRPCATVELARTMSSDYLLSIPAARAYIAAHKELHADPNTKPN
jgi:hypothetical protein